MNKNTQKIYEDYKNLCAKKNIRLYILLSTYYETNCKNDEEEISRNCRKWRCYNNGEKKSVGDKSLTNTTMGVITHKASILEIVRKIFFHFAFLLLRIIIASRISCQVLKKENEDCTNYVTIVEVEKDSEEREREREKIYTEK